MSHFERSHWTNHYRSSTHTSTISADECIECHTSVQVLTLIWTTPQAPRNLYAGRWHPRILLATGAYWGQRIDL
ncbi:hypothetical protein BX600DRAFT_455718 [Xylariales sp. PMI_506]|nr:hypothetical protein BX600DRAFT_455718 [Xylariales sp. PMI_506]